MNEYERVFSQDIREKKLTATGARHRASRGKRAITVHNQSDYLTKKQIKELSSPVTTYYDKPVKYSEFKTWNTHKQALYIDFIRNKYSASIRDIAEMMGTSRNTLYAFLVTRNIDTSGMQRLGKSTKPAWEEFLKKEQGDPIPEPEITQDEDHEDCPEEVICDNSEELTIDNESPVFGTIDTITLTGTAKDKLSCETAKALAFLLPNDRKYKVTIEVI